MKITAYFRVSTEQQDQQSQTEQVTAYLSAQGLDFDNMLTDISSGATPWQKRNLSSWLRIAKPGDMLIVSEISRIARSTIGVLTFLQEARARDLQVVAVRSGIKIDNTMQSNIVVTVLALAAEIERELLRERTKAALAARKANGLPLGRQRGSKIASKLDSHILELQKLEEADVSKRAIARLMKCSPTTVYNWFANRDQRQQEIPA